MKSRYSSGEVSISVRRDVDGVKFIISLPDRNDIELTLPLTEARKLGKLLISYSDASIIQLDLLLRKLSEIERTIANIEERVRNLENKH